MFAVVLPFAILYGIALSIHTLLCYLADLGTILAAPEIENPGFGLRILYNARNILDELIRESHFRDVVDDFERVVDSEDSDFESSSENDADEQDASGNDIGSRILDRVSESVERFSESVARSVKSFVGQKISKNQKVKIDTIYVN